MSVIGEGWGCPKSAMCGPRMDLEGEEVLCAPDLFFDPLDWCVGFYRSRSHSADAVLNSRLRGIWASSVFGVCLVDNTPRRLVGWESDVSLPIAASQSAQ
eukprot:1617333-Rhodomonas_salina.1